MGSHLVIEARRPSGDVVLTFEFLEAPNRRFYWRAVAADGSISQESAETFLSLEECAADATVRGAVATKEAGRFVFC